MKTKTTNLLPIGVSKKFILSIVKVMSGNHKGAFELKTPCNGVFYYLDSSWWRETRNEENLCTLGWN